MLLVSFADTAMCHYTQSLEIAVCKGLELYLIIIDLFHKYLRENPLHTVLVDQLYLCIYIFSLTN